jgi:hypothetical protein
MKSMKLTALLAAATFVASAGLAQAQVSKDDAKCRATVQKNTGKLTATASKAIVGCWKSVLGGKIGFTNCNDSATADTKGKITKAAGKLTSAVGGAKTKCEAPGGVHDASLAEFQDCPSPGTQGAGMTTFTQVGLCLADVGQVMADNMHRYAMNPASWQIEAILADAVNRKQIAKCGNSIQKNYSKIIATVGKVEGKEQATLDKAGTNSYDYGAAGLDPKGKIAKTLTKLNDAITKDCGPLSDANFGLLGTCARSLATLGACLTDTAIEGSGGVTQVSFDMPGVCPSIVLATVKPGQTNASSPGAGDGATTTSTEVDAGWVGFGHNNDFIDFTAAGSLSCSDGTCGSCSPAILCSEGNCRCANDVSIQCDEPLVSDADDCGGAICDVFSGPPLPAVLSSTPTCVVTEIVSPITGNADTGTGDANLILDSAATVFLGITQSQPCPVCTASVCFGGQRDGEACTGNDGTSPSFGGTSLDCPPALIQNISGSGLALTLNVSSAPAPLPSTLDCTALPPGTMDCPCAVCSGDVTIACNSDTDCSAAAAGTCSTHGSGVATLPNSCSDFNCDVDPETGEGTCASGLSGDTFKFCDGFTNANGVGIISCATNGDCAGTGGLCTLEQPQNCFGNDGDDLVVVGTFGAQGGGVLGASFCFPPTNNAGINGAGGSPGPARARIAFDFDAKCSDGTTDYRLGGANCP